MTMPVKGPSSYITAQLVVGEMECVLAGAAYTVGAAAIDGCRGAGVGALCGGTVGAVGGAIGGAVAGGTAGAVAGPMGAAVGAAQGAACGAAEMGLAGAALGAKVGAVMGGFIGLTRGASYTIKICKDYQQKCIDLRNFEGDRAQFQQVALNTKVVIRQFFENFCGDAHEGGEKGDILCPVTMEVMLYPAVITPCAASHTHELSALHELLERGNGRANCTVCRAGFEAKDVEISYETHERVREVVNEAIAYLKSSGENLLLIRQLNQEIGGNPWKFLADRTIAPLSSETEQKVFNKTPLSIEEIRTVYPALKSVVVDLNQTNRQLGADVIMNLNLQMANGQITEAKCEKMTKDVSQLMAKNTLILN